MYDRNEFNEAYQGYWANQAFTLDITDDVVLHGAPANKFSREDILHGLLTTSMGYRFAKTSYDGGQLEYVVTCNWITIAFQSSLGWSLIPENSYAAGLVPSEWWRKYALAVETLVKLQDENLDKEEMVVSHT